MDLNTIPLAAKEPRSGRALGPGSAWVSAAEACRQTECCVWELDPLAHVRITMKAGRVRKCFVLPFVSILQWSAASCSRRSMCFSPSTSGPIEEGAHGCEDPRSAHSCLGA